jgi:hypothetical protein
MFEAALKSIGMDYLAHKFRPALPATKVCPTMVEFLLRLLADLMRAE